MTEKVKVLYDSAVSNKEYVDAVKSANNDRKPNIFSGDIERHIFAAGYYGWLVGKYGDDWRHFL